MSYYRPTTEEIREAYMNNEQLSSARAWDEDATAARYRLGDQFDAWLEAIQESNQKLIREAYEQGRTDGSLFGEIVFNEEQN